MKEVFIITVDVVEAAAVVLLLVGITGATIRYLYRVAQGDKKTSYPIYRRDLGRTLLLALEILIAADIIETVAIDKTLESVGLLGALVVVRTFLSFALEVELEGRWPWQGAKQETAEE